MAKTDITRNIASLREQDKAYNENYRKWRMEHKNDYGFYFAEKTDEYTYRDGEGFVTEYPEAAERSAITKAHTVIGVSMIVYLAITLLSAAVMPSILQNAGIHLAYNTADFYTGAEWPALILTYITRILSRMAAFAIIVLSLRMPMKLLIPIKVTNKPLFRLAVPAAMLTFGVTMLFNPVLIELMQKVGIHTTMDSFDTDNSTVLILYLLLDIIIVPVISEIVQRGALMQILKQFGDGYAIFVTSLTCAMMTTGMDSFFPVLVSSLVIGYFMLKTGSVFTAIIMRCTIAVLNAVIRSVTFLAPDARYTDIIITAIILASLIAGLYLTVGFVKKHSDKISLPLTNMYLSGTDKVMNALTLPIMLMWITMCVFKLICFTHVSI